MSSIRRKTGTDHALAVIRAGLSAFPYIGGPLASLIGDYIPSSTQRRTEEAMKMLTERLAALQDRVDCASVDKEAFSELFKSCYLQIVRTHQKEKLNAAVSLIANILLKEGDPDKLTYTELDHFTRCLDALSVGAVRVLGKLCNLAEREGRNTPVGTANVFATDSLHLQRTIPDVHPSLLDGLVAELAALHLIEKPSAWRGEPSGKYPIDLTPLGYRFVKYLLRDWSDGA